MCFAIPRHEFSHTLFSFEHIMSQAMYQKRPIADLFWVFSIISLANNCLLLILPTFTQVLSII
jgi:hypothetical protein